MFKAHHAQPARWSLYVQKDKQAMTEGEMQLSKWHDTQSFLRKPVICYRSHRGSPRYPQIGYNVIHNP